MEGSGHNNNNLLVWQLVLTPGVAAVDHDKICALALVSKDCNKAIHDTAISRKNYLESWLIKKYPIFDFKQLVWRKHWSVCAWVRVIAHNRAEKKEKKVGLLCAYFNSEGKRIRLRHTWDGFEAVLPYDPYPFFNREGDVCYHGYGTIEKDSNVIEYSLNMNGIVKAFPCRMRLDGSCETYALSQFIEFPVLLQVFLQSTRSYKSIFLGYSDKTYNINGVTIPDMYKTCTGYCGSYYREGFDGLPNAIKDAIAIRYAAQERLQ
jgi:hypothetical protein